MDLNLIPLLGNKEKIPQESQKQQMIFMEL